MIEWGQINENIPNPPKLAVVNTFRMAYGTVFFVFDGSTEETRFRCKPRYVGGFQNSLEIETLLVACTITVEEMDLFGDKMRTTTNWHFPQCSL
jgi:hypothetical protein